MFARFSHALQRHRDRRDEAARMAEQRRPVYDTDSDSDSDSDLPDSGRFAHPLPARPAPVAAATTAPQLPLGTFTEYGDNVYVPTPKLAPELAYRAARLYRWRATRNSRAIPLVPYSVDADAYPPDALVRHVNEREGWVAFQRFDNFRRNNDVGIRLYGGPRGDARVLRDGRELLASPEAESALRAVAGWLDQPLAPPLSAGALKQGLKDIIRTTSVEYDPGAGSRALRFRIASGGLEYLGRPQVVANESIVAKIDPWLNLHADHRGTATTTTENLSRAMIRLGAARIMHRLGFGPRQALHIEPNVVLQAYADGEPNPEPVRRTLIYIGSERMAGDEPSSHDRRRPKLLRYMRLMGYVLGATSFFDPGRHGSNRQDIHNVIVGCGGIQRAFALFANGRPAPNEEPRARRGAPLERKERRVHRVLDIPKRELIERIEDGRDAALRHLQRHAQTLLQDPVYRENKIVIVDAIHGYFNACVRRARWLDE